MYLGLHMDREGGTRNSKWRTELCESMTICKSVRQLRNGLKRKQKGKRKNRTKRSELERLVATREWVVRGVG